VLFASPAVAGRIRVGFAASVEAKTRSVPLTNSPLIRWLAFVPIYGWLVRFDILVWRVVVFAS